MVRAAAHHPSGTPISLLDTKSQAVDREQHIFVIITRGKKILHAITNLVSPFVLLF